MTARATKAAEVEPFSYLEGASLIELARRINEVGPENARMEWRGTGAHTRFRIVDTRPATAHKSATEATDLNDARVCPPICPT